MLYISLTVSDYNSIYHPLVYIHYTNESESHWLDML